MLVIVLRQFTSPSAVAMTPAYYHDNSSSVPTHKGSCVAEFIITRRVFYYFLPFSCRSGVSYFTLLLCSSRPSSSVLWRIISDRVFFALSTAPHLSHIFSADLPHLRVSRRRLILAFVFFKFVFFFFARSFVHEYIMYTI